MKTILSVFGVLLLSSTVAFGQTTTQAIAWDYPVAPAISQAYTQTVAFDATQVVGAITCVARPAGSTCSIPFATVIAPGAHSITVTAIGGGMQVSTTQAIDPSKFPANITNPRVVVTVVVSVP